MKRKPIRRDSAADPPLAALLLFLSMVSVILFLAMDVPLANEQGNVTITGEQTQVRGDAESVEDVGILKSVWADTSCILTFGLGELFTDVCQIGVIGRAITGALSNIEIIQTITRGLSSFVDLVGNLATVNIPGAPTWVRFAIGTPIVGIISYTVILIVRGN